MNRLSNRHRRRRARSHDGHDLGHFELRARRITRSCWTDYGKRHSRDRRRSEAIQIRSTVRGLARPRASTTVERRQGAIGWHRQARRRLYPTVAGTRCSCDRWMAGAAGYAQNAMDRAAIGASARQCCNGGLRQQACAHRLGDHDARKSIQFCSGFCYHSVIGWYNKRERIKSARVKEG
jgi:hypothetical protein